MYKTILLLISCFFLSQSVSAQSQPCDCVPPFKAGDWIEIPVSELRYRVLFVKPIHEGCYTAGSVCYGSCGWHFLAYFFEEVYEGVTFTDCEFQSNKQGGSYLERSIAVGVFPNPVAQGEAFSLVTLPQDQEVELYNSAGQRVWFQKNLSDQGVTKVPTGDLPKGFYILRVGQSQGQRMHRVAIQ